MSRRIALTLALLSALPLTAASASSRHRRAAAPAADADRALYRKECGACHLDYPPAMLPAASWRQLMAGLERHFGSNAELDAAVQERLARWLDVGAGRVGGGRHEEHEEGEHGGRRHGEEREGRREARASASPAGGATLRITETASFLRKHREIDRKVVARPSIRSLANCGACHAGARQWDFDDDGVSTPGR